MKTEELLEKCSQLPPEEISSWLVSISCSSSVLESIVAKLENRRQLEAVGKTLNSEQFLDLLDSNLDGHSKDHWKISPLLVGLPHGVFLSLLTEANDTQFTILQHDSVTEPIQHHLTSLTHEIRERIEEIAHQMHQVESRIVTVDLEEISRREIAELCLRIEDVGALFEQVIDIINRALSLAWNANRTDLIEALTIEKESCQRILAIGVGHPRKGNRRPTGLFSVLDQRLSNIYGNPLDARDIDAVKDDEPAMEALVKLSIWYLKDYWELGLLPNIKKAEDLDLNMATHTEEDRQEFRERLFKDAQKNLENYGLLTVKDLKENMIYSRRILQKFIREQIS